MSAPSPLSVVIVDDDELVAQSLRTILEARGNVRVAALGTKGAEAAALFNEHHPDIMLLDIRMPDLSGLAAGEAILAAHPKARIVFLTTFADDDYIVRALAIGARGYLIKQEARGPDRPGIRCHRPRERAHRATASERRRSRLRRLSVAPR